MRLAVPGRSKWTFAGIAGVLLILAAFVFLRWLPPGVTVPADLGNLDPQLRAYVEEKVEWVRQAPRDASRHAHLGVVYGANGLWREAGEEFEQSLRLNPSEPLAHLYRAVAMQELGDIDGAYQRYRQLTRDYPDFPPGYSRVGEVGLRIGALDDAEAAFERLRELAPREWRAYAGLGQVCLLRNQFDEAARWLEQALPLAPAEKTLHHRLGMAYRALGRDEEARRELARGGGAEYFPMPDAWSKAAHEHMKLLPDQLDQARELMGAGQVTKAVQLLETTLQFHPGNPTVALELALAYTRSGQADRGFALMQDLLRREPDNASAWVALADCSSGLGRHEEALQHAAKAIKLNPRTPKARLARANALLGLERDEEAANELKAAVELDPVDAGLRVSLGDLYWGNLNRIEDALREYLESAALAPDSALPCLRAAEASMELKDLPRARQMLDAARSRSGETPDLAVLEAQFKELSSR